MMMIDNAKCLEDLRVPPSNHLEQNHIHVRPLTWSLIGKTMSDFIETPTIGEILSEEFLIPLGISAYKLAQEINVPASRIQDILHNRRKITVDTSLRLAKFFGLSDGYFISLQDDIDIRNAKIELAPQLEEI